MLFSVLVKTDAALQLCPLKDSFQFLTLAFYMEGSFGGCSERISPRPRSDISVVAHELHVLIYINKLFAAGALRVTQLGFVFALCSFVCCVWCVVSDGAGQNNVKVGEDGFKGYISYVECSSLQRLDGSIKGEIRKQALDHFNAEGSEVCKLQIISKLLP